MTEQFDLDLQSWLREGPDDGPPRVLETAFERARGSRQRPRWEAQLHGLPRSFGSYGAIGRWSYDVAPTAARAVILAMLLIGLAAVILLLSTGVPRSPNPLAFVRAGRLFIADADGSAPRELVITMKRPAEVTEVRWSPDRRHLAVQLHDLATDEAGWLAILSADGKVMAVQARDALEAVTWAPDGSHVAVASAGGGRIAMLGLDGRSTGDVGLPAGLAMGPSGWQGGVSWSPDGRWFAFPACWKPCNPKGATDIVLLAVDGSGYRQLSHAGGGDGWLAWSPDGRLAAVRSCAAASPCSVGLRILSVDGSDDSVEALSNTMIGWVAWSPDSRNLAVAAVRPGLGSGSPERLLVVDASGGVRSIITDGFDTIGPIEWSNDGRAVMFQGAAQGAGSGIWSIGVTDGTLTRLVAETSSFDADARP